MRSFCDWQIPVRFIPVAQIVEWINLKLTVKDGLRASNTDILVELLGQWTMICH